MKHLQIVVCLLSVSFICVRSTCESPYGCTFDYRPVCSKNNKNECESHANFCVYKDKAQCDLNAGWDLVSFEACPGPEQCPPEFACATAGACLPGKKDPVCASSDGEYRYYENFCEYQIGKCGNPNLRVYSKGECSTE